MGSYLTDSQVIVIVILLVLMIIGSGWLYIHKRRTTTADLKQQFGSEYERAVQTQGSERKGQAKLQDRKKRVDTLNIRELEPAERDRYLEKWKSVQERFVDSPNGAVAEADDLVSSVMQRRGYPVADFEQRAADISVDHPLVTENYRAAHAIALRLGKSETGTEEFRTAMIHYRSLFDELVQVQPIGVKDAA